MTWADAEARFAEAFDRYEVRLPQRALAIEIEQALADGTHLLAQAACGVGKSYGAMVPAIDFAQANKRISGPVIAATATKALQDQYVTDLTALQQLYKEFTFQLIKGRSNYVCRASVASMDETKVGLTGEQVLEWAEADGVMGDIEAMPVQLTYAQKREVTTTSAECPGKRKCPFGEVCFAEKVKERARQVDVVVVNHALLAIDARLKGMGVEMLPGASALIIDEAHELESYVTNALSDEFTINTLGVFARDAESLLTDRHAGDALRTAAHALFTRMREMLREEREKALALTPARVIALQAQLFGLTDALEELQAEIIGFRPHDDRDEQRKKMLVRRGDNLAARFKSIVLADFAEMVRWVEVEEREDRRTGDRSEVVLIKLAPLEVASFLREALWPWAPAVLMSATLTTGSDDFGYLAARLGLELNPAGSKDLVARTFDAGTPFDFAAQARTYVPRDMPDPSKERQEWRALANAMTGELVKASNGRALLLFTSWEGLHSAHRSLSPMISQLGHRVLKQGEAPNKLLAEEFKRDEHSVLFAVKSFFTGMNIEGDSLRLVVIDKLPFPVPDVLFKARCDAVDEKVSERDRFRKGSFMTMQVPEMMLTLSQAYGRLVRSRSDHGVVAVLDPRLHSKPSYGRRALRSLPSAPQLTDLNAVLDYLHTLESTAVDEPVDLAEKHL